MAASACKPSTFRRHGSDEMTALLLPHNMDTISSFIRLEEFLIVVEAGMGWASSVKSQPPRCSEGPDGRAVAWYCSPVVKLAAVSLHRVSSFMSSVGLVVNRHYARQVDDQTLDLLLSAGPFSTPLHPHLRPHRHLGSCDALHTKYVMA